MMRDWLKFRDEFQHEILAAEAFPTNSPCSGCNQSKDAVYRCLDCFHPRIFCQECCLMEHARHPFHRIQKWTGKFFNSTTLESMGFVLHLGHGGSKCPTIQERSGDVLEKRSEDVSKDLIAQQHFTVVDIGQVHSHTITWCICSTAPHPRYQLLRMGLYPATPFQPKTAFTFRLLEYFHVDAMECHTSYQAFFNKLRRLSNYYDPNSIKVSTKLLGMPSIANKFTLCIGSI
jgi:CxC2 like cysteine cluster associated with KDZ transposases